MTPDLYEIEVLMAEKGLSLKAMALLMGYKSHQSLCELFQRIRDGKGIHRRTIRKIADALRVPVRHITFDPRATERAPTTATLLTV